MLQEPRTMLLKTGGGVNDLTSDVMLHFKFCTSALLTEDDDKGSVLMKKTKQVALWPSANKAHCSILLHYFTTGQSTLPITTTLFSTTQHIPYNSLYGALTWICIVLCIALCIALHWMRLRSLAGTISTISTIRGFFTAAAKQFPNKADAWPKISTMIHEH